MLTNSPTLWLRRRPAVLLTLMGVSLLLLFPAGAAAHWNGSAFENKSSDCSGTPGDPITIVFRGTWAKLWRITTNRGDIAWHTGWREHTEANHAYYSAWGLCGPTDEQLASSFGFPHDRYHIRLYGQDRQYAPGRRAVMGTPHWEWWKWGCGGRVPGNHAIDAGATDRNQGYAREYGASGFDYGRAAVANRYDESRHHHPLDWVYWGNTRSAKQCDDLYAGSNGIVWLITLGQP